ncbi:MAG: bifunctional riboflavin kinase/FAD synthetase [Anaerolineaceae bacterium]
MQHHWKLEEVKIDRSWLTVGTFDGIHLGHQEIIRCVTKGAEIDGVPSVVVTFFPPPAVVLKKRQDPFYLTSPEERAHLLEKMGVDIVITHPFNTEISQLSSFEFISKLHHHLGMIHLCIGHDFSLGKNREGNAERLMIIGKELGFSVSTIEPIIINGVVVSSTYIRHLLSSGEVDRIARYLGRKYRITGRVIPGDNRGKQMGMPTANLEVWSERAVPKEGVYACRVYINGKRWDAVTNIGVRPTFEDTPVAPRVETHLLDFEGDLYGCELELEFCYRLRDERKFSSAGELVAQVHLDIRTTQKLLSS